MAHSDPKHPDCYGNLESVFPQGCDGLRHTPESCMSCRLKTECLRAAIQGPCGLVVQEEKVDRAYECGMIGFLERWSQKKHLRRRLMDKKKSD